MVQHTVFIHVSLYKENYRSKESIKPISSHPTTRMDIFDGYHFRINKYMLSCMGQWPFQSSRTHFVYLGIIFTLAGTNILAKICATIRSRHDFDTVMEDLTPIMGDSMAVLKLTNSVLKLGKMKDLLLRVKKHYESFDNEEELQIMYKYAENGRTFTILYGCAFMMTMLLFMVPPLIPILTYNGTGERLFVHHTEFFVDPLNYYYIITVQSYITIFIVVFTIVTMDTLFVLLVQHVCGLFTTLGHRLVNIEGIDESVVDLNNPKKYDESFVSISFCVRRHQEAIEFSDLLDAYYSTTFFLQAALNVSGLSLSGSRALTTNDVKNLFQHLSVVWSAFAHIFFECINGQRLIDHSSRIHEYLIQMKWDQTSMKTKKVFNLMIARSRYPCVLTAAGMLIISMETFSAILRTSMSYFTVIRSTQ